MSSTVTNSVSSLVQSLGEIPPDAVVFGQSELMQSLRTRLDKVAGANVPVLIHGESGTGKDIIARLVHALSPWKSGPFVKVNCPAIPGTLLESELFGYERGAFTGAYGSKPGRVELAHRGTLFLDEISELDMPLQSKLLQLLQDGQFCRIGAQADKKVEVRIVCATNRRLEEEIENGTFRQDLFYRINVVNLFMPPLRERRADIEGLAGYFLEYSGFKFAIFFMAEYFGMFAAGGMAATLFLGGYAAPVQWLDWIPSWVWFFTKMMAFIFLLIWVRGTVPRLLGSFRLLRRFFLTFFVFCHVVSTSSHGFGLQRSL